MSVISAPQATRPARGAVRGPRRAAAARRHRSCSGPPGEPAGRSSAALRRGCQSASSPSGVRVAWPAPTSSMSARSAAPRSGSSLLWAMIAATSWLTRPPGKRASASQRVLRRDPRGRASCRGWRSARRRPRRPGSRPPPGGGRRARTRARAPSSEPGRRSGAPCPGSRWAPPPAVRVSFLSCS